MGPAAAPASTHPSALASSRVAWRNCFGDGAGSEGFSSLGGGVVWVGTTSSSPRRIGAVAWRTRACSVGPADQLGCACGDAFQPRPDGGRRWGGGLRHVVRGPGETGVGSGRSSGQRGPAASLGSWCSPQVDQSTWGTCCIAGDGKGSGNPAASPRRANGDEISAWPCAVDGRK